MELVHYEKKTITINGKEYPFSQFLKLEPNYYVPHGLHTRVYRKGKEHYATDGMITVQLPTHDGYCDRICNREGELARLVALLEIENQKKPTK
jgi:hypothetical protein